MSAYDDYYDDDDIFYIVYPGGDRGKLAVVAIGVNVTYKLNDYDRASSKQFGSYEEAESHAKHLAVEHNKTYMPDKDRPALLD